MKGKILAALMAVLSFSLCVQAQKPVLRVTEWKAYGVQFKVPAGFVVEDDSEDGYIVSTPVYYITLQLLDGTDLKRSELADELKHVAVDDELKEQTPVASFETPQFYGVYLRGNCETDQCLYSYLLDKGEGSGFFVSIVYAKKEDRMPETILKSFKLVE